MFYEIRNTIKYYERYLVRIIGIHLILNINVR